MKAPLGVKLLGNNLASLIMGSMVMPCYMILLLRNAFYVVKPFIGIIALAKYMSISLIRHRLLHSSSKYIEIELLCQKFSR